MRNMKHSISLILAGASLAAMAAGVAAADVPPPDARFEVRSFQVEGNRLLPQATIDALLAPHAGQGRSVADLRRAAQALEAAYRAHGFGLVRVVLPEQEMQQGTVRLRVVETRIGKVTVQGNTVFDTDNIRRSMPALREGASPDLDLLSENLRLANENPGKKTVVRLQGGEREGEVDALVNVTDSRPWRLGLTVDNSGVGNPGRSHVGLSFQHANIGGRDHVLTMQAITALEHPGDLNVIAAGYRIPLYALGDSVELFGIHSDIDAGSVNAGPVNLQISGKGNIAGARYYFNLAHTPRYDAGLVFGVDYKAYQNDVQLLGLPIGNDVTVHPVGIGYVGRWTLDRTDVNFNMTAWRNIPGGSHGSDDDIRRIRSNANPDYALLRYGAGVTHALASDWQVHAAVTGQWTDDSLIAREQFGIGGADTARGFVEREIADDSGYAGRVELYTPNLCARIAGAASQCRVLAFHDRAHVSRNHVLPGERSSETLASAGLGLRFALARMVAVQLDVGRVTNGGGRQAKGEHRMHFLMNVSY